MSLLKSPANPLRPAQSTTTGKRASSNNSEQKRRDIEKYSEAIFYSARYSGTYLPCSVWEGAGGTGGDLREGRAKGKKGTEGDATHVMVLVAARGGIAGRQDVAGRAGSGMEGAAAGGGAGRWLLWRGARCVE